MEEIVFDDSKFATALRRVKEKYFSMFVPEYFEQRLPRNLELLKL